jgi:hypothetical protein
MLKNMKICFKCAHFRHQRGSCRATMFGVNNCNRPHHATLHYEQYENVTEAPAPEPNQESVLSVTTLKSPGSRVVLLKMCPVIVTGPRGDVSTFTLLDEGATVTLIDEDLAGKVGAKGPSRPLLLQGVNMTQDQGNSRWLKFGAKKKLLVFESW